MHCLHRATPLCFVCFCFLLLLGSLELNLLEFVSSRNERRWENCGELTLFGCGNFSGDCWEILKGLEIKTFFNYLFVCLYVCLVVRLHVLKFVCLLLLHSFIVYQSCCVYVIFCLSVFYLSV